MAYHKCSIGASGGASAQMATGICNANAKVTTGFQPDYVFIYGQPNTNTRAIIVNDAINSFIQKASLQSSNGTFTAGSYSGDKTAITIHADGFTQAYVNGAYYVAVKE